MLNCDKSRKYFFLAVNTGFVTNGEPDARCRDFYKERSGNDLYCAIVGNVVTPQGIPSNNVSATISNSSAWKHLAQVISARGTLAGIQLASAWVGYNGMKRFVPNPGENPLDEYKRIAAAISKKQVIQALDGLFRGTELAVKAGFRHVQLHAAHGYLFNLLVDRRLCAYSDFALQRIRLWAKGLADSRVESSIRLSMLTGHRNLDEDNSAAFVDEISEVAVDYIDVSNGFYNIDKRLIYPSTSQLLIERATGTLDIASRHLARNFIISGKSHVAWNESLPPNVHIGICRDLIANPNYMVDRKDGCHTCMKCHYFSRGESHLTCGRWPIAAQPATPND